MGHYLNKLIKKNSPVLPEELISGVVYNLSLKQGDKEAFEWLRGRYIDADLIRANMEYQGEDDETDPYPHIYKCDASAFLLAHFCISEGGLGMLSNGDLKSQIGTNIAETLGIDGNNILDKIYTSEYGEDEYQGPDVDDDYQSGPEDFQDFGSSDDWGVDTEATEGD